MDITQLLQKTTAPKDEMNPPFCFCPHIFLHATDGKGLRQELWQIVNFPHRGNTKHVVCHIERAWGWIMWLQDQLWTDSQLEEIHIQLKGTGLAPHVTHPFLKGVVA